MLEIDKNDYLYKVLTKLKVENVEEYYTKFAGCGLSCAKDFYNYLQDGLGLNYLGEIDENVFEEVLPYYRDLKKAKCSSRGSTKLLKDYKQTSSKEAKEKFVHSKLKDVLLIACTYKLRHPEININDLVQICNIGLLEATEKYEINSKIPFDVYLHFWILEEINKEFTIGGEKYGK